MPRKAAKIRKTRSDEETKAWLLELVSRSPKALGRAGSFEGEVWSLRVLYGYVVEHGQKLGYFVSEKRPRAWPAAPELKDKLTY